MKLYDKIVEAADYIKAKLKTTPKFAIILGTGLGAVIDNQVNGISINYSDLPHFATSTVDGHEGRILLGELNGTQVIILQGRFHYYEGYSMEEVTLPVRVLKQVGIEKLIITNASGSLNSDIKTGDMVIVNDHISLFGPNPLRGIRDPRLGDRFPDMTRTYDLAMITKALTISEQLNLNSKKGIYSYVQGPSLETPAEHRLLKAAGADVVGMSTVPEVIVAKQCGLKVCVISCVTNECISEEGPKETSLEEVIAAAQTNAPRMKALIEQLIA